GANDDRIGPRFFDVCNMYDEDLRTMAKSLAGECKLRVQEGIYAFHTGPHFETPAEIRFLRMAGADAVGMSTITEALTAAHCGLKTLAISLITNMAAGVNNNRVDGAEVDLVASQSAKEFRTYLKCIIENMKSTN
ncbi:MAG: purine-nucleoside phosphorylase, partial [Hungatella hathewayi]|nr:purine-nucleoside phosphorylase [Hungatella hathewayi]